MYVAVLVLSCFSYWRTDPNASVLSCLIMAALTVEQHAHPWPHADQVIILPQFLWTLLVITGNRPLPLQVKTGLALLVLSAAITASYMSPLVRVVDDLPLFLTATLVFILFHHYYLDSAETKHAHRLSSRGASVFLAFSFSYHAITEILKLHASPETGRENALSIVQAGFFAVVGLAASSAFRDEIKMNEKLEALVKERTEKILEQTDHLHMVEHAMQASETAIAITDSDQRIMWCNLALEKLSGVNSAQLKNNCLLETLLGPDTKTERLCEGFQTNTSAHEDIVIHDKQIHAVISRFPDARRKEEGPNDNSWFLVVLNDTTEARARERAEQNAKDETAKSQAMQESMQTLSHELRTPLQGIMGMTSLILRDTKAATEVIEAMTMVMTSAQLLLTLINNILDVRKMDASMLGDFYLSPINLARSLRCAIDFCKPCAHISDVKLEISPEAALEVFAESNDLRLQQVLINLISNAIKHSVKGSSISVGVRTMPLDQAEAAVASAHTAGPHQSMFDELSASERRACKVAVISVSDEGEGLPKDDFSVNVFGRFTQLDSGRAIGGDQVGQPSGTGLGLNLCLKFVQRMKGNIWVQNNTGRGSTFSFFLPLSDQNVDHLPNGRLSKTICADRVDKPLLKSAVASRYRVLVVDDTIINLKIMDRMLKQIGVAEIATVSSGREALNALSKQEYDLVLSDLQMPGMSGLELSTTIQVCFPAGKPIVIGFTADTSANVERDCLQSGMAHVLHKPLTADQVFDFFETDLVRIVAASTAAS